MKRTKLLSPLLATVLLAIFLTPARTQEAICVDSSHYNPELACYLIYIPLCTCNGANPGNDCFAFKDGLSCWSQKCELIDLGCEVAFSYAIDGDQLMLKDESPTADGDEVAYWEWQNNYETFAMESPEAVLNMPPEQTKFKVSLSIRTAQGCIAYCTYLIDRTIDSGRELTEAEPSVFPNPLNGVLHIRNTFHCQRLRIYSLDGRRQLDQPLQGALQERVGVAQLSPGIYLVEISGEKGARTFKVMVR